MNKKVLVVAALLIVGAILAVALLKPEQVGSSPTKVRIGALSTGIDYAPFYVAREKGWFEDALKDDGITVEYTTFQSLPPVNEAFATGRIDFAFEAEIPAIIGRAAGADVRIAHMLSAVKAEEIVVPTASTVNAIPDLRGKKIAVMPGSGYHFALLRSLEAHGISRGDVTLVDMTPPDAKAAFQTGAIDAWSVWPHWPEQEVYEGRGRLVKGLDARVQVVTAVRGSFAKDHPKEVAAVLAVLERAKEWVEKNPSEAQQITSKAIDLRIEIVRLAWPKEVWDARLTQEVITDIQSKSDFLKTEGLIKTTVDVRKDLIYEHATISFLYDSSGNMHPQDGLFSLTLVNGRRAA